MFNSANKLDFIDIKKVLPQYNQEDLFAKYTGIYPELNKKYYSIFRQDKNPGCRFKWHSGILYFVENTGFHGKLYFNIADAVAVLHNVDLITAINKIVSGNTNNVSWEKININKSINEKPEIRFKYKDWEDTNYFGISPDILNYENVFHVTDYWIKKEDEFKYNCIHNPKQTLTIAYYFPETNHVKLYFPEKTEYKWFSNCDNDIFGEFKINQYLEKDNSLIIITKSQKDRLLLDYKYGYNAIAPQNEGVDFGHIVPELKKFKEQLILFDNDRTGQKFASIYSEKYDIPWLNIEIAKDIFDAEILYGTENLKTYLNEVIRNHKK